MCVNVPISKKAFEKIFFFYLGKKYSISFKSQKRKHLPTQKWKKIQIILPVWLLVFSIANCSRNEWSFYIEQVEKYIYEKSKSDAFKGIISSNH